MMVAGVLLAGALLGALLAGSAGAGRKAPRPVPVRVDEGRRYPEERR